MSEIRQWAEKSGCYCYILCMCLCHRAGCRSFGNYISDCAVDALWLAIISKPCCDL